MAGDWKVVKVQDIAKRTATGPFGSAISSKHFTDSGVPVIRGSNLSQVVSNRLDDSGLVFVSEEKAEEFKRSEVRRGDLVFTCWGTIDQVGLIDSRAKYDRYIVSNKQMLLTPDESKADSLFLYFYFASPEVRAQIINEGIGSSVPGFNLGQLRSFEIPLPPLAEQKAIAAVLGALDDKIELNRRMNATLEAMARALFQSWFVDFDPVRAKLDGRPPAALDPATAALFPGSFQDSELGHIPKGWTAGTVVEGFNLTMGQSPPGDTYNEEGNGLPFYQGRTDFGFRFPKRRIYCTAPTRYAKPGDTLVSVRAPVGDINMANEECCIGRGVAAVRHKSGATSFTYHSMANLYPDFARFEAEGTVFGSINKDSFEKLPFVIPPAEIVAAYERQAGPLDEQIRTLENQSRTLATLRDTLLPKLLSGELSVADFAATG
jgi:type I restriction enzyme S subunit